MHGVNVAPRAQRLAGRKNVDVLKHGVPESTQEAGEQLALLLANQRIDHTRHANHRTMRKPERKRDKSLGMNDFTEPARMNGDNLAEVYWRSSCSGDRGVCN